MYQSETIILDKNIDLDNLNNKLLNMKDSDSFIIVHKNGISNIIKNNIGIFSGNQFAYIPNLKEFQFEDTWFIKKPSINILDKILFINKELFNKYQTEFYIPIYWNIKNKEYEIIMPKQSVNSASVTFEYIQDPNLILVIDLHSHGNMSAFFSSTDDTNDSTRFKLSMVIGKNDNIVSRMVINSIAYSIDVNEIFNSKERIDFDKIKFRSNKLEIKRPKIKKECKYHNELV
jgi:proteasome lid subunit RPN8/RPN11